MGEADGLEKGLEEIGDGAGGADFEVAVKDGGDKASDGGREVGGGEIGSGEEFGEVVGELGGELGLSFELGVVVAEVGMGGEARSAATAAVGEGEAAKGETIERIERWHE